MTKGYEGTVSLFELFERFPTEDAAFEYLESRYWPNGPVCPSCESQRVSPRKRAHFYRCKDCRKDFTVRVGTIFEHSHIPLRKWVIAIHLLETARMGVSSMELSKHLGIAQESAWFMLHRIREACGVGDEPLAGDVEVDETYLGGKEGNKHASKRLNQGRGTVGKQIVMGMKERGGDVAAFPIPNTRMGTFERNVLANVEPGSTVYTDEHSSYQHLGDFYEHQTVNHSAREYVDGLAQVNSIENFWSIFKRGYHGVYVHWSPKNTHRYANEFAFRLNEGDTHRHSLARIDSVIDGAKGKRLTKAELTA